MASKTGSLCQPEGSCWDGLMSHESHIASWLLECFSIGKFPRNRFFLTQNNYCTLLAIYNSQLQVNKNRADKGNTGSFFDWTFQMVGCQGTTRPFTLLFEMTILSQMRMRLWEQANLVIHVLTKWWKKWSKKPKPVQSYVWQVLNRHTISVI